jgi:hypothetical protein
MYVVSNRLKRPISAKAEMGRENVLSNRKVGPDLSVTEQRDQDNEGERHAEQ